jgi:hypothetical protein
MFEVIFTCLSENAETIAGSVGYTDNPAVMILQKNEDSSWLITDVSEQNRN